MQYCGGKHDKRVHIIPVALTHFLRVLCSAVLMLALSVPSNAATISLDYSLGFNGYFRLGTWTPLSVVLENRGRASVGTLEVIITSGSEFLQTVHQTIHAADIELPYNSTKLSTFTVHLGSFTHDIHIRLRNGDEILTSTTISLRAKFTEQPMVVVLDERITPDFLSVLPAERFAVNALPRFLPETVFGYEGVEMLIVNAEVLGSLREQQFQALRGWLRQGGFLVTSGSMNYGVLQEPRWQQLMPMHIRGHREFSRLDAFSEFCGQALSGNRPFLVLEADLPDGQVLLEEDGFPLLTAQPIGVGRILFLALDVQHPPFSRWSGRQMFWKNTAALRPEGMRVTLDTAKDTILDALLVNMPADFPDRWLAFGFLAVYLISFKLVTASFGKRGARHSRIIERAFLIILLFTGAGYAMFMYPTQHQYIASDSLLHVHASGNNSTAIGELTVGVFGLKNTTYTLGFGDASYPVRPVLSSNLYKQTQAPYMLYQTDTGQRIQGMLEKWSYSFFTLATPVDFRMQADVRHNTEKGLEFNFQNPTAERLNDVYGYFAGRLFPLGAIAAESTTTKTLSMSMIQEQELFDTARLRSMLPSFEDDGRLMFWQRMQKELLRYVLALTHTTYNGREDMVILVGWMPSVSIETIFDKTKHIGASATLVTWSIPVN